MAGAKTANLNMRIDPELKEQAQNLFKDMGLNTSDAVTLFLMQCLKVNGLPFQISSNESISK